MIKLKLNLNAKVSVISIWAIFNWTTLPSNS